MLGVWGRAGRGRAGTAVATVAALSVGFDRWDPSIGLTPDLRLTNLRLVVVLTVAVWLLSCGLARRWPRVPRQIGVPAAAWLAALILSALLAPTHQTQALAFVRDLALGMTFGWAVYDLASNQARQVVLARALAVSALGVAAFGLAEATGSRPIVDWLAGFRYQATFNVGEITRASSTLPHPNITALLLSLALPLQLAWALTIRAILPRILLLLGAAMELQALILTVSRAGMLGVELVLCLMLVIALRQRHSLMQVAQLSLAAAIGLPLLLGLAIARQPILVLRLTSEAVENWYRADYSTPAQMTVHSGEASTVPIRLANSSDRIWSASGTHPFALSYHLEQVDGTLVTYDGTRTPLPVDLAPGSTLDLQAQLVVPQSPGTYVVEWDEVQEGVTWFSWVGTPVARMLLTVVASPISTSQTAVIHQTPAPAAVSSPPPSRLTQWRTALRMARNRPLLGVGPDNFRWVYGDFAGLTTWDTGGHANSLYFEWLADTGILGLGLFLWLAWKLVRTSFDSLLTERQSSTHSNDAVRIWRLALAASLAVWFLHGTLDYFFEPLQTNVAFWLVAALAVAAAESAERQRLDLATCGLPSM